MFGDLDAGYMDAGRIGVDWKPLATRWEEGIQEILTRSRLGSLADYMLRRGLVPNAGIVGVLKIHRCGHQLVCGGCLTVMGAILKDGPDSGIGTWMLAYLENSI